MIARWFLHVLWCLVGFVVLCLFGCGGALQPSTECPPPDYVFHNAALLSQATEVQTPGGCTCDAPLRPALTSSWPGGCSYTYEARCDACVVDVTWSRP